jgi:hypothetical protein
MLRDWIRMAIHRICRKRTYHSIEANALQTDISGHNAGIVSSLA